MKRQSNIEIGARVRIARERLHMSREKLAELLDRSTLFIGYIECGQKGMSIETLLAICKTLQVSADYLLFGNEPDSTLHCEAAQLLSGMPQAYLPLAAESLRTLVKTIAVVQANEHEHVVVSTANVKQISTSHPTVVAIAAQNGMQQEVIVDNPEELCKELARLANTTDSFKH